MDEQKLREITEALSQVNRLIKPYQLAYVSPSNDCQLLQRNARYMTKAQLARLTENIKKDNFLSQIPLAIREESGKYIIISGNHRVKAAIKAELEFILIQYLNRSEIDHQKELALQLSHNAIAGQDDLTILLEIYNEITSLDLKEFSGIDEQKLLEYEALNLPSINEKDIAFNEIRLFFSGIALARVDKTVESLKKLILDEKRDRIIFSDFYDFIDLMTEVKRRVNIKNDTVAFMKMIEICEDWITQNPIKEDTDG